MPVPETWRRELCGITEIVQMAGVTRQNVWHTLLKDPRFPHAVDDLSCGRVWSYEQVRQALRKMGYPKSPRAVSGLRSRADVEDVA